jgi:hypothetical protein
MADALPIEVVSAVKVITSYVAKTGVSITGVDPTGRQVVVVALYPCCCMEHAQADVAALHRALIKRRAISPATPTDEHGKPRAIVPETLN